MSSLDYGSLVSAAQPQVVHDEASNRRFINMLRELDVRWKSLTDEERKLHELLVLIIQDFERRTYQVRSAAPAEVIQELLQANEMESEDLAHLFESATALDEILEGKRALTADEIRRLAERFHVSPAVFF